MSNARSLASFLSGTPTADFNFDSNSLVVDISENTVGIGDTTPDGKLEVRQTASADILNLYDDTTNVLTVVDGGNVGIGDDSPDGKLEVRQSGTDDIFNLYDDTTNVLTVVDGGKVGIGTSTPDGLVDIRQSGTDDILNLYDGTDNIFTVVDGGKVGIKSSTPDGMLDVRSLTSDDIFNLYDGSTNVFTVVDGGNVGIGTSTPSSSADTNLHVKGSSTASIHIEDDEKRWEHYVNGYYLIREVGSSTNTRFFIEEDTGNVGIGTSAPTKQIHVLGNADGMMSRLENNSGSTPYGLQIVFSNAARDNNVEHFAEFTDTGANRFQVFADGDVKNHDNSYGQISDERIKTDIIDANSQWNDIKAVRVRNFKRKDDVAQYGDKAWSQIGVVAQELEKVSPKLIKHSLPNDFEMEHCGFGQNIDGEWVPKKIDGKDMMVKGVSYSVLYMKAFKALQEAMIRIETLETKVNELENA